MFVSKTRDQPEPGSFFGGGGREMKEPGNEVAPHIGKPTYPQSNAQNVFVKACDYPDHVELMTQHFYASFWLEYMPYIVVVLVGLVQGI